MRISCRQSRPPRADADAQRAPRGFGLTRSWLIPAGLAGMVASLAFTVGAQATPLVTQSAITSPSDPLFVLDQGQTQTVTIVGTANAPGDDVNIDCYHDDGSSGTMVDTVAANVAVQSDGTFSTSVPIADLEITSSGSSQLCRLRAVDSSGAAPTTGLSAFAGPRTAYSYLDRNGTYEYYMFVQQLTTADDYLSLGGCGLDESYSDDATGAFAGHGFWCNDWTNHQSQSDASKSGITVDGEPAYDPDMARFFTPVGIPVLSIDSATQDPATGDVTIIETEPIVFCQGNPAVPATGCPTFIPAGVQDRRTITQTLDGHVVTIHDAFSSTDGSAHSVDLLLENDQAFGTANLDHNQDYLFPGQSSWVQTTGGESETLPADGVGTIYVRNITVPDGSSQYPLGGDHLLPRALWPGGVYDGQPRQPGL